MNQMIADIEITEKSYGAKVLMTNVALTIDDGEKVGVVGRNGIGKSTLFGILAGTDTDYTGRVAYRRGVSVVATAQDVRAGDMTVLDYILDGLPEYADLRHIITTYPDAMGDDMTKINEYSEALERFGQRGFYDIEQRVTEELKHFQLDGREQQQVSTLSGGQKRLIEIVKIMHSDAHLALVDEPTNHMDYVAKQQFIDWMKTAREAVLVITHDRDVLREVDRIVELRDGYAQSYKGNYDAYLRQNAVHTTTAMSDFEMIEKRIVNLKQKVLDYQRMKEKARNPGTIANFKRLENQSREELAELESKQKPTFWIDKDSVETLGYKSAGQYQKFKSRTIRLGVKDASSRSSHVLVRARDLALGYDDTLLFEGVNFELREGEAVELRGRNGAGKSTLINALLGDESVTTFDGELFLDPHVRVGRYEQEVPTEYFDLSLHDAIERTYLDRKLSIGETKIRQLMSDYLFTESDGGVRVAQLSGGQKARLQLIAMLANDPQLLILDEPTNHLDLPSIEELEQALARYNGALLYVSHDGYFRRAIGGDVVQIGSLA